MWHANTASVEMAGEFVNGQGACWGPIRKAMVSGGQAEVDVIQKG